MTNGVVDKKCAFSQSTISLFLNVRQIGNVINAMMTNFLVPQNYKGHSLLLIGIVYLVGFKII